ncbi:MAG: Gfo/Idh/MocA family oxidoreductase [Planctomycetaceae bacterium]|nr:Gfo/Idh/MocA family oxidoreductase [Planctomycetaceae bacterium]
MAIQRRDFIALGTAAAAGVMSAPLFADAVKPVRVALAGCGRQGRSLINAGLKNNQMKFAALCDIQPTALKSAQRYLEDEDTETAAYSDFQELLAKEKSNIDAVIIATPDFVHSRQTLDALDAGWNVYCETMMATNIADARKVIQKAEQSGKVLQIAFERRSDPRYRHVADKLLDAESRKLLFGTITHFDAQAYRRIHSELIWAKRDTLEDDYLKRYGYKSMAEYRNWRNYRHYCNGQCTAFFAQQFDVFEWYFNARPTEIKALGGLDYFTFGDCYDNASALLTYQLDGKPVRAAGRVWMTTSGGGTLPFEHILGVNGSLQTSLNAQFFRLHAEPGLAKWNALVSRGDIAKENVAAEGEDPNLISVRETGNVVPYLLPVVRSESVMQLHLQNFIEAVRGKVKPNCTARAAFPAHVIAWKIAEAAETGKTVVLDDKAFAV